jgi:hypothetical protein
MKGLKPFVPMVVIGVILLAAYHPGLPAQTASTTQQPDGTTTTTNRCSNLVVPPLGISPGLKQAHAKIKAGEERTGAIYYGRCGKIEYSLATFVSPTSGITDQPEIFTRKDSAASWQDLGGSGGSVCHSAVPIQLTDIWGLC